MRMCGPYSDDVGYGAAGEAHDEEDLVGAVDAQRLRKRPSERDQGRVLIVLGHAPERLLEQGCQSLRHLVYRVLGAVRTQRSTSASPEIVKSTLLGRRRERRDLKVVPARGEANECAVAAAHALNGGIEVVLEPVRQAALCLQGDASMSKTMPRCVQLTVERQGVTRRRASASGKGRKAVGNVKSSTTS